MTVKALKEYLADKPDDMPVCVVYDLNDWPGDSWDELSRPVVTEPVKLTTTGSAEPGAKVLSIVFDVRH